MPIQENLGPAERIIGSLLTYSDHLYHGRCGVVSSDHRFGVGVRWEPVSYKVEDGQKVVYKLEKVGKKSRRTRIGVLTEDNKVMNGGPVPIAEYRPAGLFPEVATWFYKQVAEVWTLDNEFAARWASYAFDQEHRDLKVVLAAFMLVQARKGAAVLDAGKIAFYDEDYRDVGEAMMLIRRKDGKDLNPKLLLRIHDVLRLPAIAAINHDLGFGLSARRPFLGRWPKTVEKWLRHREQNPRMLDGLVKAGFRTTVMELARRIGYKPETPYFFEALRWKQCQAEDGRRTLAIGEAVKAAESWAGLSEMQVCEKIVAQKPDWKRIVGLLPKDVGVTRAVVAAAIEAACLSDKDLIILTPTLEELGLLDVPDVRGRWEQAVKASDDMRAANIARNVQSKQVAEKLQEAADIAVQKAVEEVVRQLRVYFLVDISGSMAGSIDRAKVCIAKFLQAFPLNQLHVAVFNTAAREIVLKHSSAAGVENAFRGIQASGGTDYGAGVRALSIHRPKEDEDALFIFVGDEEAASFTTAVQASGLRPLAFGFLKTVAADGAAGWRARQYGTDRSRAVRETATQLGIPCCMLDEAMFDDPYAIPRTLQTLIAATPVGVTQNVRTPRVTLIDRILKTPLLPKPAWA